MKKIILSILSLVIILAGCSSADDVATGEINLEFWIPGAEDEYGFYYDAARQFSDMTEGVTITPTQQPWGDYWTKLPLEINNGRGPALFITHTSYEDVLVPITAELDYTIEELNELGYSNTDLYVGENNKPLFIPALYAPNVIYYNTTLWDQAGLTDSDIPTTWDELEEVALQLKDEENKVIGFDYSFHILYDLALQNDFPLIVDNEAKFYPKTLEIILKWEQEGVTNYMGYGAGSPEESFIQGASAMIYGQPWMANYFENTMPDLQFKSFPVPTNTSEKIKVTSQAELTPGISKNLEGEEMAAAQEFIKWMLTNETVMNNVASGNNAASSNSNYIVNQEYSPGSAGSSSIETINGQADMFIVIPSTLEDAYNVLLESTISNGEESISQNIDNAKVSTEKTDFTLTEKLQNRKLSE